MIEHLDSHLRWVIKVQIQTKPIGYWLLGSQRIPSSPSSGCSELSHSSMASLLTPHSLITLRLQHHKLNRVRFLNVSTRVQPKTCTPARNSPCSGFAFTVRSAKMATERENVLEKESMSANDDNDIGVVGIHHVGILCENLEKSLDFYQNILGLEINEARPHDKLPYRGAWLWVGSEMIHLMELPNPDPLTGRPQHGGRDRHACIAIGDVSKLKTILDKAGIPYTLSRSGRPAIFTRDPDANALEFVQLDD